MHKFSIKTPDGTELEVQAEIKITPGCPGHKNGHPEDWDDGEPDEIELLDWKPNEKSVLADCINALQKIRSTEAKNSTMGKLAHECLQPLKESIETYAYEHRNQLRREIVELTWANNGTVNP